MNTMGGTNGIEREFEQSLDDEREVDLSDEPEPTPPPTLDPDERVEEEDDPMRPLPDDQRPV